MCIKILILRKKQPKEKTLGCFKKEEISKMQWHLSGKYVVCLIILILSSRYHWVYYRMFSFES